MIHSHAFSEMNTFSSLWGSCTLVLSNKDVKGASLKPDNRNVSIM